MNRRQFVTRLVAAATGVFVASKLPLGLLPEKAQRSVVIDRLNHAWNNYMRGKGSARLPVAMFVSVPVFDAFEREMRAQTLLHYGHEVLWAAPKGGFMFKGTTLRALDVLRGWDMAFQGPGTMMTMTVTEKFWRNRGA